MRDAWEAAFAARALEYWTPERTQALLGGKRLAVRPDEAPALLRALGILHRDASMPPPERRKFFQINHMVTLLTPALRPLVEAGRVYSAVPPLHRIELSNPKKGQEKYRYTYSDPELQRALAELRKKNVSWKDPVQRYKGLGEMDADQLAETTMDPRRRTLRRLTVDDAEEAAKVFDLLMGSDVAPRKEFIVQGAYEVDVESLDA